MAGTEVELAKDQVTIDQLIWTEYFFSHFFRTGRKSRPLEKP